MKLKLYITGLFSLLLLCIISCSKDDILEEDNTNSDSSDNSEYVDPNDDELDNNSQEVNYENQISIVFSDGSAEITNPFDGNGVTVSNTNGHVVITSTITSQELNYVLSGSTSDGSVKIYGEYKFGLILNGVEITNPSGAAINNQCGKKVTVTVVDETNNRLIDGSTYTYTNDEDMKGTFFSEGQLNFYGTGTLEIRGKNKHAICVDDYFHMYEGNILIKEAASDAIHANDYIQIDGGILSTVSTGEGLDCEKGYVEINGGTLSITTTGEKGHGVKSLETIAVNSNETITIKVVGQASKAFKSGGDMTITQATLNLTTTGNAFYDTDEADISSAAGIKCDGNLLIENGAITINSSGKGGKGINVDGTLTINDGTISVTTTGDQFTYGSDDTAAKAIKSEGNLTVNGGTIRVSTSKTEAEGMESKSKLYINGGDIEILAYDDCINASSHIEITGGKVYCYSETNDGIDSNGTLTVSGGTIIAVGTSSPEEGIDCDQNRFSITGGTLIGVGGATSTPTSSACTQRSLVYATSSSIQLIHIESSAGKEALTFKIPRTYSGQMTLLFSSSSLEASTSYTIYTGGSVSGGTEFNGLYTGATYTKGTSASTFTTSSMVTSVGSSNQGGNQGGRPF